MHKPVEMETIQPWVSLLYKRRYAIISSRIWECICSIHLNQSGKEEGAYIAMP